MKRTKRKKGSASSFIGKFRKKQRNTSIYFLTWSIFTAFSLVLILIFSFTYQMIFSQTYKKEAYQDLSEKGKVIERAVCMEIPKEFGGNYSGYLRFLSANHDVNIFILNEEGYVLYPQEPNFDPEAPEIEEHFNFSDVLRQMLSKMEKSGADRVVFEGDGEYVYGSKIVLFGDSESYLYIGKSLSLLKDSFTELGVRMTFIAIFVLILAFAVSSAVSGWLTKPLSEMTQKAKRLAKGDFDVDFHGVDYGQEMVVLADTLNSARDELAQTDRMQKELIANVSHDFKTPLTMIKAYASMIQEISGDIPEKRNKHAQVIVDEADRLASLVNDVLDLSKLRAQLDTMNTKVFNMSDCVFEIVDRFTYLKETQGYTFITDVDEDLYTYADELKIEQVLYNLIGNAVNYTGEDKKVYIKLKKDGEESFRFEVRDTGVGIKAEELPAVWDRYYRSSETHKRPIKGTGLGLSIVKAILEKHNFEFGVQSEKGKGSTFFVTFPCVKQSDSLQKIQPNA